MHTQCTASTRFFILCPAFFPPSQPAFPSLTCTICYIETDRHVACTASVPLPHMHIETDRHVACTASVPLPHMHHLLHRD